MIVYVLKIDGKRAFAFEGYEDAVMKMILDAEEWKKEIEELRKDECMDLPFPGPVHFSDSLICKMCTILGRRIGDIFDDNREYEIIEDFCDEEKNGKYYVLMGYDDDEGYVHYKNVDILDLE